MYAVHRKPMSFIEVHDNLYATMKSHFLDNRGGGGWGVGGEKKKTENYTELESM